MRRRGGRDGRARRRCARHSRTPECRRPGSRHSRRRVAPGACRRPAGRGRFPADGGAVRSKSIRLRSARLPGLQSAAIVEAEEIGGFAGQALDDEFERQARPAVPVARPMRQHVGGHAGIDDHRHMRAAVAEPEQGAGIGQHLADRPVVVLGIAGDREEQQIAGSLGQIIIGDFVRRMVGARRDRGDARFGPRLVVGRVAHQIHAVPPGRDQLHQWPEPRHQCRRRPVRDDRLAHRRVAQQHQPLGQRQPLIRLVALADRERVQRCGDAEDDADRAAGDLRRDRGARGARPVHTLHDPPPALRVGRPVGQEEPHRAPGLAPEAGDPFELGCLVLEIAVHAKGAGAGGTEPGTDPGQFVDLGKAAGHHLALRSSCAHWCARS